MYDVFTLKDYSFPKGFPWGSAYAGHQVEGNNENNWVWGSYLSKFGLVDVNRESGNFERTPKPSAYFYRDIIKNNGFNQEILRKYLTELPSLDPTIK